MRTAMLTAALAAVCGLLLGGCLGAGDGDEPNRVEGPRATVYLSAPGPGVSARTARAVTAGARRALAQAGGRAGGLRIRLRVLPATDAGGEHPWDPDLVSANAERAAEDPRAIAYLGELDHGASAVSLPITNDAGLLQVSPADGLTSLTERLVGRARAGPERYYPSGERSFARRTPTDLHEVELLVERLRERVAPARIGVVFDREVYGREFAAQLSVLARRAGIETAAYEQYGGRVEELPDIAAALAASRPDVVVHAGVGDRATGRLLGALAAALPRVPLYAASGVLAWPRPARGAPAGVEALAPALSPHRSGYTAMRLILAAIEAGGRDRRRVVEAALRLARRGIDRRFAVHRLGPGGRFERVGMLR